MLPYIVWRPLYLTGFDFYRFLCFSTRVERRLRRAYARAEKAVGTAALSALRLALFKS